MGIVAELNQKYFDGGLSEAALNNLVNLEGHGDEVDEFTERSFRFMNEEGFPARDFLGLSGLDVRGFRSPASPRSLGWNDSSDHARGTALQAR